MASQGWWEKSRTHQFKTGGGVKTITAGTSGAVITETPSGDGVAVDIDLGTMAVVDDAPADGSTYGRKENTWVNTNIFNEKAQSIRKDFHAVTAGAKLRAYIPNDWNIEGVSVLANTNGALVVDIWKIPYASYPATGANSICASAKPTLSASDSYLDETLTGWNKSLAAGDTLIFNVDSATTVTDFEVSLYGTAGYGLLAVSGAFTAASIGSPLAGSPLTITGGQAPYTLSGSPYSGTRPAGVTISISGSTVVAAGNTTTAATYTWTERVLSSDGQHYDVPCSVVVALTDPYWASVVALLHMDGTNGSTSFIDEKGHTFTASGSAQLTTSGPKFGTACGTFDTSGSSWVYSAASSDFAMGTGDWTVELWWWGDYSVPDYSDGRMIDIGSNGIAIVRRAATGFSRVGAYTSGTGSSGDVWLGGLFNDMAWNHLALVRSGGNITFYINGVTSGSQTTSQDFASSVAVNLGRYGGSGVAYVTGLLDDVRITKGVARYTADFTPPSMPFPNS